MSREHRMVGPPGTGKTTTLAKQIVFEADKRGGEAPELHLRAVRSVCAPGAIHRRSGGAGLQAVAGSEDKLTTPGARILREGKA